MLATLEVQPQRTAGLVIREDGSGQYIVYNPLTDELHIIKPLAREVLMLCDGERSVAQILSSLAETDERLGSEAGRSGVLQFLKKLSERRLLSFGA